MEVNVRCPFWIECNAAAVWTDPGTVVALLLHRALSQLSAERDPAVFENLDARPVSDRAGRWKIQKRTKIDAAQVLKKPISASFIVCQSNCIFIIEGPDVKYN